MNWLLSFLVGVLTAVLGLVSAGLVAAAYAQWYHVTTREGAAGFFVMGISVLGSFAGLILGIITSRLITGPTFWKSMACSSGIVLGISAIALLVCYVLADIPPKLHGDELRLEVELRLPPGQDKPGTNTMLILGSVINGVQRASQTGEFKMDQARLENGRLILPGEVFVFTTRGLRMLRVEEGQTNIAAFMVPLPSRPKEQEEQWSEWLPRVEAGGVPWPDTKSSYRFRVQRIPPPPPPLTRAELDALEENKEQSKFDAIAPDAPLSVWIPYTQPGLNQKRSAVAMERITRRPGLVAELSTLMFDSDARQAADAMYLIGRLPAPSAELVPGVTVAGRDIIERLRKFNESTVDQDPSFEGAADVSVRFAGWMEAVRTLRKAHGADLIPELGEILKLSRVRTDSQSIESDVRRVASYYLKEWAGVPPEPSNPPPR